MNGSDHVWRRIIFVCGTPHGGAADSTLSLATAAARSGVDVEVLIAAGDPYRMLRRSSAALVKVERRSATLGRWAWRVFDRCTARTESQVPSPVPTRRFTNPIGAVRSRAWAGDLLVVNSVRELDLHRLIALARHLQLPIVWYARESTALAHAHLGADVDVLLANSVPLAQELAAGAGRPCSFVPSVIERAGLRPPVERGCALLINPIPSHGLDIALDIARARSDLPVVLQESWPLSPEDTESLRSRIAELPNIEFRRRAERHEIYRDARVLLAPHLPEAVGLSRPRVALESQLLGIPMIAHDLPGLAAVASAPDLLIRPGSDVSAWADAIDRVGSDFERYSAEATEFAERELLSPDEVWRRFLDACCC